MAKAELQGAAEHAVDQRQRPIALLAAILAGEQRYRVHAAPVQRVELLVDRFEPGGLAHQGAIVAAHPAHAALGIAGVGQVQRRERLQPDRSCGAGRAGELVQLGAGHARGDPQQGRVGSIETHAGSGPFDDAGKVGRIDPLARGVEEGADLRRVEAEVPCGPRRHRSPLSQAKRMGQRTAHPGTRRSPTFLRSSAGGSNGRQPLI
jgi:hypothetical protein